MVGNTILNKTTQSTSTNKDFVGGCCNKTYEIENNFVVEKRETTVVNNISTSILPVNTMSELRNLSNENITLLKNGGYKAVLLLGYYTKGDKPPVTYIWDNTPTKEDDGGYIIAVNNDSNGRLLAKVNKVTYADYGTNNTDDTLKVKKAHEFANENNLPVESHTPTKLVTYSEIEVKTDTKVTNVTIDETNRRSSTMLYHIKNDSDAVDVEVTQEIIDDVIGNYKTGSEVMLTTLSQLGLAQHYIIIQDNDRVVNRSYGSFKYIRDMFVLDKDGMVVGKPNFAPWTGVTSLVAYPIPKRRIKVDFEITLINSSNSGDLNAYLFSIISAQRSNTDYVFSFFKAVSDTQVSPSNGHISFNNVCKITANGKSFPLPTVNHGTYGIGGDSVFDAEFKVNGTGSESRWGIWGTNNFKNITFNKCNVNRLDVHFNAFDIYIQDCNVGNRGIHVTGGGDLYIDNTTVSGTESYLNLRGDYGSKWDGDIKITNAKYHLKSNTVNSLIKYNWIDFNYNTEVVMAREIIIDDVTIYGDSGGGTAYTEIISVPNGTGSIANNTVAPKVFLPNHIKISNIKTKSTNRGCRIINISDSTTFASLPDPKTISWGRDGFANGNRLVEISSVIAKDENSNFFVVRTTQAPSSTDAPSWNVKVSDCGVVGFRVGQALVNLEINRCTISNVEKVLDNRSNTVFNDCIFNPDVATASGQRFDMHQQYTYFNRCTLLEPNKTTGNLTLTDINNTYTRVFRVGSAGGAGYEVWGNHVLTRLGTNFQNVIQTLTGAGVPIAVKEELSFHADSI